MFKELQPLLRNKSLLLSIASGNDDQITVVVMPKKTGDGDNNADSTPLVVKGTAEELDQKLAQELVGFTGAHLSFQSSLAAVKSDLEASAKAAREERKKATKPATPTTAQTGATVPAAQPVNNKPPEKTEPPPPPLFAAATENGNTTDSEGNDDPEEEKEEEA